MNYRILTGRLSRDPDYRVNDNGLAVCRFTVAADNGKGKTEFVDCKAFRQKADFVNSYFTKGKWIAVNGYVDVEEWNGKDGKDKKKSYVIVDNVEFIGSKSDNTPAVVRNEDGTIDIATEEELPF